MDSSKKISLPQLAWTIFSVVVGISYLGSLVMCNPHSKDPNGFGLGLNVVWIFAFEGIIIAFCAYAFAKLSSIHSAQKNGGAYIYARTAFGRLTGYLVAAIQYVILPFVIAFQIMMLMKGFFSAPYVPADSFLNQSKHLGPFADLILDLIGLVIYATCASVVFFGIKIYKKLSIITGSIKWITAGFLILVGIVLTCEHGKGNYSYWYHNSHLTLQNFLYTFTAAFFYFTGFEQVITSTKNIENPQKTIGKALLISISIVVTLYVVVTLLFFGATTMFSQNMMIALWSSFHTPWLTIVGSLIMLFSQLAMKAQVSMINCFNGSTMLHPLSDEGYISERFKELNKDNFPLRASFLHMALTGMTVVIWLIVPDIINGVLLLKGLKTQPFSVNLLTSVTSVITIFIYAIVILAVFKNKRVLKLKMWEMLGFGFTFGVLVINFVYHYYSITLPIIDYIKASTKTDSIVSGFVASLTEIIFTVLIVIGVTLNYVFYYLPKYKARMLNNPQLQKQLDDAFTLQLPSTKPLVNGLNLEKESFLATK